jgi:HPt (histidine-containing phosphotransfer) domain-containing protein
MNPLELRKLLLIAESELNRAQLVQEWQVMASEVHSLAHQARTIRSIASAVTSLVAGLAYFRREKSASTAEKPSWLQTVLKGVQLAGSLWSAFRPQSRGQKEK